MSESRAAGVTTKRRGFMKTLNKSFTSRYRRRSLSGFEKKAATSTRRRSTVSSARRNTFFEQSCAAVGLAAGARTRIVPSSRATESEIGLSRRDVIARAAAAASSPSGRATSA